MTRPVGRIGKVRWSEKDDQVRAQAQYHARRSGERSPTTSRTRTPSAASCSRSTTFIVRLHTPDRAGALHGDGLRLGGDLDNRAAVAARWSRSASGCPSWCWRSRCTDGVVPRSSSRTFCWTAPATCTVLPPAASILGRASNPAPWTGQAVRGGGGREREGATRPSRPLYTPRYVAPEMLRRTVSTRWSWTGTAGHPCLSLSVSRLSSGRERVYEKILKAKLNSRRRCGRTRKLAHVSGAQCARRDQGAQQHKAHRSSPR